LTGVRDRAGLRRTPREPRPRTTSTGSPRPGFAAHQGRHVCVVLLTGRLPSFLDRLPAGSSDPEPDDLHRLAASLHALACCCCKPAADQTGNRVAIESMGDYEQPLGGAVRIAGQQL
jgi:hypothetical protein